MKIGSVLVGLGVATDFPTSLPKYDVNIENIPDIGSLFRYKVGDDIEVPVITPKDEEITYLLRANNYREMLKIEACLNSKACDKELTTEATVVFKLDKSGLNWADVLNSPVKAEEAQLDEKKVRIKNVDFESGGFWWSVHGSQSGNVTTYQHDKMSLIMMVESCQVEVEWLHELDFNNYGWHKNGNELEFNPVGFNENDPFAQCKFKSSPPSDVSFENGESSFNGVAQMLVPIEQDVEVFASCNVDGINKDSEWKVDKCQGQFQSEAEVLASPNKMDYFYNINTEFEGVFYYLDKSDVSTDLGPLVFKCPIHDNADSLKVIGTNYPNSPEFINSTETASPMSIEMINYRGKQSEMMNGIYLFEIEKDMLDFGVFEYRCVYRKNNKLLGYSRPAVVSVYNEGVSEVTKPKATWGSSVEEFGGTHFVREGQKITVASCHQTTAGAPAAMQFVAGDYKYPHKPVKQHAISLDLLPNRSYLKTELVCKLHFNDHESHTEVSLGSLEIIHKPIALDIDHHQKDLVTCKASPHHHDNLKVALKINRNFKLDLVNGEAHFNLTKSFTESQLKRFNDRGTRCIFNSEQFPEEIFESKSSKSSLIEIIEDDAFDQGFPWGVLLMLGGIAAVLSMCIGWNKAPTTKKPDEQNLLG